MSLITPTGEVAQLLTRYIEYVPWVVGDFGGSGDGFLTLRLHHGRLPVGLVAVPKRQSGCVALSCGERPKYRKADQRREKEERRKRELPTNRRTTCEATSGGLSTRWAGTPRGTASRAGVGVSRHRAPLPPPHPPLSSGYLIN